MKVVAVNGSSRRGGNTSMLIDALFAVLEESGIACERIDLAGKEVRGCRACWRCGGKGNCAWDDDAFSEVFERMKEADGIVLASPVYAGNVSASMQAILERSGVVCDMNRDAALLSRKVGGCAAVARRGGALNALDAMTNFFLIQDMYAVGSSYWPIAYGQMPGEVADDEEGMATMRRLGKNMAHLLAALDA